MNRNRKLELFRKWAREATYNELFVYHREPKERDEASFEHARKLSDAGLAFLSQRRLDNGMFEYCALRSKPQDIDVLDKVSARIYVAPSSSADCIERGRGRPARPVLQAEAA